MATMAKLVAFLIWIWLFICTGKSKAKTIKVDDKKDDKDDDEDDEVEMVSEDEDDED